MHIHILHRSTLIKTLAELAVTIGGLEDPAACAANVYERLIGTVFARKKFKAVLLV
jgi:hypothetical protein